MDKVFSVRMDEFVVRQVGDLSHRLRTSRKQVIEQAVRLLARQAETDQGEDLLVRTFGAWKRAEAPTETAALARKIFRESMVRRRS
jgi:metal-responsive CopG/Arc/MetJ family transcriptional regulator